MEDKHREIKALFIRLANGNSTPAERLQILDYLRDAPSPEAIPTVEELQPAGEWPEIPEWAAEAVMASILQQAAATRIVPFRKRSWVKIAAALVPIAGITSLMMLYYSRRDALKHYVNNSRAVQTIQLADGTLIHLNQQARLSVSAKDGREVWLEGEAFFSVQQQAARPFVVHAVNMLDVTVLGTAFNVNAKKEKTQVVLNAGSVKVGAGKAEMVLRPGEMADYDAGTGRLLRQPADTLLYTSWKYDLIAFRAQSLKDVLQKLKEQYGYDVVFEQPDVEKLIFTGYLASNDLPQALTTLEQAFSIKIRLQNNQIYVNTK